MVAKCTLFNFENDFKINNGGFIIDDGGKLVPMIFYGSSDTARIIVMIVHSNTSTLYICVCLIFVVLYAGPGISCVRATPKMLTSDNTIFSCFLFRKIKCLILAIKCANLLSTAQYRLTGMDNRTGNRLNGQKNFCQTNGDKIKNASNSQSPRE